MRTDTHRPSAISPSEYKFVAFDYIGPNMPFGASDYLQGQRQIFREHMKQTGGTYAKHENSGTCHICGATAFYLVRWYHAASNSYIQTGEDCAAKMEMSYGDFNYFQRQIRTALEAVAGKRKAQATLEAAGLSRAWEVLIQLDAAREAEQKAFDVTGQSTGNFNPKQEELTIADIVGKLIRYGSISPNQESYLHKLLARIDNRANVEAQRKAEAEAAEPVPAGRVRVTGTVVGTKVVEDRFDRYSGEKTMLIIKDARGFKVYGSCFAGLHKGDAVDMVATLTVSQNDSKFGFYKRPVVYRDKALEKFLSTVAWG